GVPEINMMSIQDFVSISLGKYIRNNLGFGKKLKNPPQVFGVNYFLKDKAGQFVNDVRDKHVWVKWMELRVHNEVDAIQTPTGFIPRYEDLQILFKTVLSKDYTRENYIAQFTLRIPENLAKIQRVKDFYSKVPDAPEILFEALKEQQQRLERAREKLGDYIKPDAFV
ncbi:MAG: phosphoenolpyruvate carboxykinase domain-containing protein, partial [Candidatus Margulisiibacteriota bacterium]